MRRSKTVVFAAAGLIALILSACGAGPAEELQTHTFDYSGNVISVSVDVSGGWDVRFSETTASLYDGAGEEETDPVAFGVYQSPEDYEARLAVAGSNPVTDESGEYVVFTDSFGVQEYAMDLGDGVRYAVMVRPEEDAQEIVDRFRVELLEKALPENEESIFLTLVNRTHKLPDDWESRIELVETQNYFGEPIRVEKTAYEAYQALREDLRAEGVDIELESGYRSVERQEDLWAEYEEKYGVDYCKQYVAVPGFSEHHTGFAIDTNLIQEDTQADETEKQEERIALWAKVHEKMPDCGFILRYPEGREDITGYAYEPWHIRYVGDPTVAREIMDAGLTLEEYLGQVEPAAAIVDYGTSFLYTERERKDAVSVLRADFDTWGDFAMRSIRYAGDESGGGQRLAWLNEMSGGKRYFQCIGFVTDFRSPSDNSGAFAPDTEYTDYPWWLARTFGGDWELVSSGVWN